MWPNSRKNVGVLWNLGNYNKERDFHEWKGLENQFKIDSITNLNKRQRFFDKLHDQFKTKQNKSQLSITASQLV